MFSDKMVQVVNRKYPVLFTSLCHKSFRDPSSWKVFADQDYVQRDLLQLDGDYYYPAYHLVGFSQTLALRLHREPLYIRFLVSNAEKYGKALLEVSGEVKSKDYSRASDSEVTRDFESFCKAFGGYLPALGLFFIAADYFETTAKRILREKSPGRADELFGALSIPKRKNFYKLERLSLLKIASKAKREGASPAVLHSLEGHFREFAWFHSRFSGLQPYEFHELEKRLEEAMESSPEQELEKIRLEGEEHGQLLGEAEDALGEEKHVAEVLQEFIYHRTHRTDVLNKAFFEIRNLVSRLAELRGLTFAQLIMCTLTELNSGKLPLKEVLEDRSKEFAFVGIGDSETVFTGKGVQMLRDLFEEKASASTELKGKTACLGQAKGPCKIIGSKADYAKFQNGDVLVASMTTPDMVVLMEKALAIVTDEGGITCHAAIVSRELNKPCVISTKTATKVFKDGDILEVDATKGIVRKA